MKLKTDNMSGAYYDTTVKRSKARRRFTAYLIDAEFPEDGCVEAFDMDAFDMEHARAVAAQAVADNYDDGLLIERVREQYGLYV